MRWWYSAIADEMIANPHLTLEGIANVLRKHPHTIRAIARTDSFRAYLETRKKEYQSRHDFALVTKVTQVAEASLDVLLEHLEKKRTTIPVSDVMFIANSSLDRLGYSPQKQQSAAVQVNVNAPQNPAVDVTLLAEARQALRAVEAQRALAPPSPIPEIVVEEQDVSIAAE